MWASVKKATNIWGGPLKDWVINSGTTLHLTLVHSEATCVCVSDAQTHLLSYKVARNEIKPSLIAVSGNGCGAVLKSYYTEKIDNDNNTLDFS